MYEYSARYCAILTRFVVSVLIFKMSKISNLTKRPCGGSRYYIQGHNKRFSLFEHFFLLPLTHNHFSWRRFCCGFRIHSTHTTNSRGFQPSVLILTSVSSGPFTSSFRRAPSSLIPTNVLFQLHHGFVQCV